MNSTKLVNILRTFSKNEMKEFEKLISSPYFNRGRNYTPIFSQLKKFYPGFDDIKMTPEYIYSKMYPGKKFNKQIIWNMTSSMTRMAEDFLMHAALKRNIFQKNKCIADELLSRNLPGYFMKKLDEMEKTVEKMRIENNYFAYKKQIEADRVEYHFFEDNQHLLTENILKNGEYTVVNFLKEISSIISDMNANIIMYNADFRFNMPYEFIRNLHLENLIEYARSNNYKYAEIMEMYYCYIMVVLKPDKTEYFFRLKQLFEENYSKFSRDENHIWANALTNYCSIIRDRKGNIYNFREIQFEIIKFQLEKQIAFPETNPSKILFIQILKTALSVNEIEWAREYIEEYIPKLRAGFQKTMRSLAYAYLFLKLKDYSRVLENLVKVKFIDVRDKLSVRSLYIMTYYELNDIEALVYQVDSTRHFISKNPSININVRNGYSIFLNNINKLLALKQRNDNLEIGHFKQQIVADRSILFIDWLIEKINELPVK